METTNNIPKIITSTDRLDIVHFGGESKEEIEAEDRWHDEQMKNREKRLELFSEEELIIEVMEEYIYVIEDTHAGFLNDKVVRRRECFDKLKTFIAKSIQQAIAEDRDLIKREVFDIIDSNENKEMQNLRIKKIFIR